jgi:hypothetical protein
VPDVGSARASGRPKDLVALCSEAIVIPPPDHRPCM